MHRKCLSSLECVVSNAVSPCMLANYVSAIKASFILHDLPFQVLDHPKVKYFIKAVKINRLPAIKSQNVISISMLVDLSLACDSLPSGKVYRAALLLGFFAFLRLANLAPHSVAAFDHTRHFTGQDVFFTKKYLKLFIKWSKTMQSRDKVLCITVRKLENKVICPFMAVKKLCTLYPFTSTTSLLQVPSHQGLIPLTDSRMCKTLKSINLALDLESNYFTFYDLRRPGASYAYNAHNPVQEIKRHGTWSSDCVWQYIQSDHASGEHLANALATTINAL